ncbi:hypothetical protein [Enterococcus thailandicus]|uniref:hypothetical protein n=1 Tax=Enterococcus TaxID=1350 RepID=UPI0032E4380F
MSKTKLLEDAYLDDVFQKKLQMIRLEIESDLRKFITEINNEKKVGIKIFENLESRVKSRESFLEKIKRKDYINEWELTSDKEEIQKFIESHLPDLIGYRINCFFYKDEKVIFDELKKYYESNKFDSEYYMNFNENRKQENGHPIFKLSGQYKKVNFEIQIKCSVHNVWGEVDHNRIYKGEHYDPKLSSKKQITEEVFNILRASDKQLETIFEEKYSEEDLIKSLFYQYTYNTIISAENTPILAKHYRRFFDIFKDKNNTEQIKKYLSIKLINGKYEKSKLDFNRPTRMTYEEFFTIFIEFEIQVVFSIASLLYEWSDINEFVEYLINRVEVRSSDDLEDEWGADYDDSTDQSVSFRENLINMYDYFSLKKEQ